jgi:4-amino-4-deoxy-L-arabinose transferase-like glycosyltransferase
MRTALSRTDWAHRWKKIVGVLLIVLLVRLSFFVAGTPWDSVKARDIYLKADPGGYHQLALNLLQTGRYAFMPDPTPEQISKSLSDPKLWRLPGEPEALWPPLYSLFIAGIYAITGVQIAFVLLMQILLSLLVAVALYGTCLQLFKSEQIALLAMFLFAIEPTMILLSNIMYSDFIFILFLSIFYFLFTRNVIAASRFSYRAAGWGLASGLVLGLASMTHARGVMFLPIALLVLLVALWGVSVRFRLLLALMLLIGYLVATGYWYWRNYRVFGEWAFSTASSYNLLIGASMVAPVQTREASIEWVFRQARTRMEQRGNPFQMNPFERAQIWRETALELIRAHPTEYLRAHGKRMLTVAFVPGTSEWEAILARTGQVEQFKLKEGRVPRMSALRWAIFAWGVLLTLLLYGAGIAGLLRWGRTLRPIAFFVALAFIALLLTSISNTHPRMRAPALLLLLPYSAAGLASTANRIASLVHRRAEPHG